MRSGSPRQSVLAVAVVLLLPVTLAAQTTTGSLRGTITDASGAVLPGVTVELSGTSQIGGAQTAVTDQNGQYRFPNLSPGLNNVNFARPDTTFAPRRAMVGLRFEF
jgi:protocatechuate 3,4-dioxygenase beta subunit